MGSKSVFGLLLVLAISQSSFAKVNFISIKNEEWRAQTLQTISWINAQLPSDWPKPQNYHIAYVENGEPSYYPIFRWKGEDNLIKMKEKILVVNDKSQAKFFHEYAHLVYDEYMRANAPGWQYYLAWNKINFSDLDETIESYKKQIQTLEKSLVDFQQKLKEEGEDDFILKVIGNVTRSITEYKELLAQLLQAQKLQTESTYPYNSFNPMSALMSYNELFADSFAVLLLEDWKKMRKTTEIDLAQSDLANNLVLPPAPTKEEAIELYLQHRDFRKGLMVETYHFQDWELDSPYTQFAPIRSQIRDLKEEEGYSNTAIIGGLGEAIENVYELELIPMPSLVEQGLYDKNKSMELALEKALATDPI